MLFTKCLNTATKNDYFPTVRANDPMQQMKMFPILS